MTCHVQKEPSDGEVTFMGSRQVKLFVIEPTLLILLFVDIRLGYTGEEGLGRDGEIIG